MLLNIFIAPQQESKMQISTFFENNFPGAFDDNPQKKAAFVKYFSRKVGESVYYCVKENLEAISEIYKKCICYTIHASDTTPLGTFLGGAVGHVKVIDSLQLNTDAVVLTEYYREKINILLKEWKAELLKWGKQEDDKIPYAWYLVPQTRYPLVALLPIFIALSWMLYAALYADNMAIYNKIFIKKVPQIVLLVVLYSWVIHFISKHTKHKIAQKVLLKLQTTFHLDWREERKPTHKADKTISFQCVLRDPSLDAGVSRSTYQRLKGKGGPLATEQEESSTLAGRRDERAVEEEEVKGLYLLNRVHHFGEKPVYGYLPPSIPNLADADRNIFEKILSNAKIIKSEGQQGIKYLTDKKLCDPISLLWHNAWEIKRMDTLSSGDRLLGASYLTVKNGEECIILIFNTYDPKGITAATKLALPLETCLPPGFTAKKAVTSSSRDLAADTDTASNVREMSRSLTL